MPLCRCWAPVGHFRNGSTSADLFAATVEPSVNQAASAF
ncbi:hypothetical protein APY04_1937 [Hyphomicrobium sulfonivorans]|uniref:Uncharacterized protein n=1 Tax=Hyphomicrobium sulfonivorans TaxID=121290 RepID=A0A109BES3_HYPSL|nr:hypothetical protein APY04_1937 [Hyphomicrobium sulfonivorans]